MSTWDILKQAEEQRAQTDKLHWEGTFKDYLDVVSKNPKVADLAHARMYDMIAAAGIQDNGEGKPKTYKFFEGELFGMERTLAHLVEEYFAPAARRLDIRKRILMLVGPVGGGKSTLATLLKKGLEKYSRTRRRAAIYAIHGCPMHEEPLHLIPEDLRDALKREIGVYVEGDLCPVCAYRLKTEWGGKIDDVPVVRMTLSERERRGVGTFKPADPKVAGRGRTHRVASTSRP